ncbi:unnamed protein product [Boreogadus saida]
MVRKGGSGRRGSPRGEKDGGESRGVSDGRERHGPPLSPGLTWSSHYYPRLDQKWQTSQLRPLERQGPGGQVERQGPGGQAIDRDVKLDLGSRGRGVTEPLHFC